MDIRSNYLYVSYIDISLELELELKMNLSNMFSKMNVLYLKTGRNVLFDLVVDVY